MTMKGRQAPLCDGVIHHPSRITRLVLLKALVSVTGAQAASEHTNMECTHMCVYCLHTWHVQMTEYVHTVLRYTKISHLLAELDTNSHSLNTFVSHTLICWREMEDRVV